MASTRRLAAILAADVAGYSRLTGADEEATRERLRAHLRELVDRRSRSTGSRRQEHWRRRGERAGINRTYLIELKKAAT
jgi:class 3 adenylate cyclase